MRRSGPRRPGWRKWGVHGYRRDQGVATVWVAVTTVTLSVVFGFVLALGQVVAARHRAGGAADLAALAAADRALEGPAAACRSAGEVAVAQGAEVVRCTVQGEIADVTARVRRGPYAPEVRSRAGPATAAPIGPIEPLDRPDAPENVVVPRECRLVEPLDRPAAPENVVVPRERRLPSGSRTTARNPVRPRGPAPARRPVALPTPPRPAQARPDFPCSPRHPAPAGQIGGVP